MLLAAGRGQRMRPLTDTCPKPLLAVRGHSLLHHHLQALARAGVRRAVINTGWLGAQIEARLGACFVPDGGCATLALHYSREPAQALESAGGIARALPLLGDVFWLVSGDVYAPDFSFALAHARAFAASGRLAHLWLVPNPAHHPGGDFVLDDSGLARNPAGDADGCHTYSGLALLRAALFAAPWCAIAAGNPHGVRAPLAPVLRRAAAAGHVSAALYGGLWCDVGTPQRLAAIRCAA